MIRIHLFKEKEKEGSEGIPTRWLMEGSNAWWFLKVSNVWWPMEGEGETPFHLFPFSPKQFYLNLHFFFDLKVLLYHGFRPLFMHFLSFP